MYYGLKAADVTFNWDAGTGATGYILWIGSSPGSYDLLGEVEGTALTRAVTLPADGRMIYVSLYSLLNGAYKANTYSYRAFGP